MKKNKTPKNIKKVLEVLKKGETTGSITSKELDILNKCGLFHPVKNKIK